MDKEEINGTKNKISPKEGATKFDSDSRDKRTLEENSRSTKHQPKRIDRKVGNRLGRDEFPAIIGGILGLLREIVNDYLKYIDSHGSRLEARLIDNKETKSKALEKAAALEKELIRLLEQADNFPKDVRSEEE